MAFRHTSWFSLLAVGLASLLGASAAQASPSLVVDVDSGEVLYQEMSTAPWYPASLTKLMTVYVALSAVREGRITLDTPMMVSPRAAVMPPSKMGFRPGTLVTLDNALKMLMVKSPNDVAVTIAEGISGSVESFADDMNVYATRLGLHESHFVNPNGLPDDRHVSSARDMAMIGRALLRDFPEQRPLFGIGVLSFGRQLISNHNGLLGRYPGVDGMKTGYTCSAGYNVVESAERNGHRLIAVIMGAPSTGERNLRAAALFDRYFADPGQGGGRLDSLPASQSNTPPDLRSTVCGHNRRAAIAEAETADAAIALPPTNQALARPERAFLLDRTTQGGPTQAPVSGLLPTRIAFEPVRVFVGPVAGWSGRIAQPIGMGAKEVASAPVKTDAADAVRKPVEQASAGAPIPAGGPVEAPITGPMALLGATPLAPAALATKRLVGRSPSLGLRVGAAKPKPKPRKALASAATPTPVKAAVPKPGAITKAKAAKPGPRAKLVLTPASATK